MGIDLKGKKKNIKEALLFTLNIKKHNFETWDTCEFG